VLTADRREISADGEDVAMFAVEVQDAQGRTMPIAGNPVSFRLTGQGRVMGTGNGDPTNHEPDPGSSRKAFNGFCIAAVQSTKTAGSITVEATSPGLASCSATVSTRAVKLRPQVAAWQREIPTGEGITGLWRAGSQIFALKQSGATLTGTVEGGGRGGDTPVAIQDGKVDGAGISFAAANVSYTGSLKGDTLELQRAGGPARGGRPAPATPTGSRPAIGPPPDGSDPSNSSFVNPQPNRAPQPLSPLLLHRSPR
jgi:beta-galactosidase